MVALPDVARQAGVDAVPVRAGDRLEVHAGDVALDVTVESVTQRNWSRVARGTSPEGPVFLKQFVDRVGRPRPSDLHHEVRGVQLAATLPSVETVPLVGESSDRLVLAYRWSDVVAVDDLLRRAPHAVFERRWRREILPGLPALLDDLAAASATADVGAAKHRPWASAGEVVGLKGLDVRNLGVPNEPAANRRLVLFDPGKPYRAPVEEAAAKLVVSVGLLNWGAPVGRFRRGVPRPLLADVLGVVAGRVNAEALRAEVDLQRRVRLGELPAGRGLQGAARRGAVLVLGRRYLRDLEEALADAHA